MKQQSIGGLIKLSGRIVNYKCTRGRASFVFTQSDQTTMGVIAVAAGLAGMGGQAMAAAVGASDLEEEADFIEFCLDGKLLKGWVWRSPFKEGDQVEIAAEGHREGYELYGIARPADRTIALYPHCSRGKVSHYRNAIKWWLYIAFAFAILFWLADSWIAGHWTVVEDAWSLGIPLAVAAFFAAMVFNLSKKWLPFVTVAEKVFKTLDWPHPRSVDLKKSTKAHRKSTDSGEYGAFYFYY
jgi:hypothetical protein